MIGQVQRDKLTFEGVYTLENPQAVLVLKEMGDEFFGYVSDGQQVYKVIGEMNLDYLRLTMAEGPDRAINFLAIDENGNLMLTDEKLNVVYFTRSTDSVDELISSIEKQRTLEKETRKLGSVSQQKTSSKGNYFGQYANKKFLHIYEGNGNSERWAYYLYENGGFYFRSSESGLSNFNYSDFSLISSDLDAGQWKIEMKDDNEFLVLTWNSGQQVSLQIQKEEFGYLLNGVKYFLVSHEEYE
ncbi:MAG: hypothetical protein IPO63_15155 [Bacteroidetes bacterium]|nr:hypothetical protein [Bacteroidota bacterium]